MGNWIHIHRKFTLKSNFWHITKSCFTPVLCCQFPFTADSYNFSNFLWNHIEIDKFFTQNLENGEKCHSRISRFLQMMTSEITFLLISRKFHTRFVNKSYFQKNFFIKKYFMKFCKVKFKYILVWKQFCGNRC